MKKNKTRFFLVSYFCLDKGRNAFATVSFNTTKFVNVKEIEEVTGKSNIQIINIYEFKNKKEFEYFRGENDW